MVLYENFNTTNQTSPHFERHEHFAMDVAKRVCNTLVTLPQAERCAYIENSASCKLNVHFINYAHIIFCELEVSTTMGAVFSSLVLLIIIGVFFTILGVTADVFFCPALAVMARMLKMSENVAGVTLVAFGNGAPDIFSSLSYLSTDTRRLYADIFASALFVVLIVAGIVFFTVPFAAQPYLLLRDALFLLLDVCVIDYVIKKDSAISVIDSAITLFIYFCYLFVVLFDQYLVRRATKILQARHNTRRQLSIIELIRLNDLRTQGSIGRRQILFVDRRMQSSLNSLNLQNKSLFGQFFYSINPYNKSEWEMANWLMKAVILLRMPILFVLTILIPINDHEEDNHGWSRLLNCAQFILLPTFICYATWSKESLLGMPVFVWVGLAALPIAILMFLGSDIHRVPFFHQYLSILTVIGSTFVVRVCCKEIFNALSVLSIFTGFSSSFFGATLLAWANCIGDLFSNHYLARKGYQNMALAACFGGPLFNSLLAVGSTILYKSLRDDDFIIEEFGLGIMGENSTIFLIISLVIILLAALTTDFFFRPSHGVYVIMMYLIFFSYNILGELDIVHPYGTDHRMDRRIESEL
ncbi:mitochondrial sodium/calcium exchanger protein-like [Anastrepha ludens]|uniref:mitochondrial sodium/calcium exchanger protein-like n=1 Tax=Anastrepha ludens TaxID=28586 RepID=UPI0023AED782|nr:mitochondrial sodium/calcium exchanger protein-like [Anastrepha ludens]